MLTIVLLSTLSLHLVQDVKTKSKSELEAAQTLVAALEPNILRGLWQLDANALRALLNAIVGNSAVASANLEANFRERTIKIFVEDTELKGVDCSQTKVKDFSTQLYKGQPVGGGVLTICYAELSFGASAVFSGIGTFLPKLTIILLSSIFIVMLISRMLLSPLGWMTNKVVNDVKIEPAPLPRDIWDEGDELDELWSNLLKRQDQLDQEDAIAQATFEAISNGVIILDENKKIIRFSDSVYQIYSLDENVDLQGILWNLIPAESILRPRQVIRFETMDLVSVEVLAVPLQTNGHALIIRDVTQEARQLADGFAAQKFEALADMAGGAAHDFNNILAVISGASELALHGKEQDVKKRLNIILDATRTGTSLVHNLRNLAAQNKNQNKKIEIKEILDRVKGYAETSRLRDITIKTSQTHQNTLYGDVEHLESALLNLVVNAVEATKDKGIVTIRSSDCQINKLPGIAFEIKDNGAGIDPADLQHIQEPYFSTKKTKEKSGMGLPMVQTFVSDIKGKLEIQSKVGLGTTVTISIPASQPEKAQTNPGFSKKSKKQSTLSSGRSVLVIEDQETLGNLLVEQLQSAGITAELANSVDSVLSISDRITSFDYVLCDVMLKDKTALDLFNALSSEYHSKLPSFIFMSGNQNHADVIQIKQTRGAKFIPKPFLLSDLFNAMDSSENNAGKSHSIKGNKRSLDQDSIT